jgi:acid phosphatase
MCNDMHDCSIGTGDTWLKKNLDAYAQWAKTHNSLLIVTFDEDSGTSVNQIFTTFTGANVKVGSYSESINHYTVLRTIEAAYGLPGIGNAASKSPILDVWQ